MRWDVRGKIKCHIVGFTGISFSGERFEVDIWPMGGRQGDEIDGSRMKSIGIIAPYGVRMTLMAAASEEGWEELPWRAVQVLKGYTFDTLDGKKVGVQIPDLDRMDPPHVRRVMDPEASSTYPHADSLEDGKGWTFGRSGGIGLKCNVRQIRVERLPVEK